MRETFIIRTEWAAAIFELDVNDRAIIFDNLFHFHMGNDDLIILNNLPLKLVWSLIQPNLLRNIDNYDKRRDTSVENGKKGGRPKGSTKNLNKPIESYPKTNYPNESLSVSDSVPVSDSVSESDPVDAPPDFEPRYAYVPPHQKAPTSGPEISEVKFFFAQNGVNDDTADRFFNRYESTGWMIGLNSITNWRAVARSWLMEPHKFATPTLSTGISKQQVNISENQKAKEINRLRHESGNSNTK